jgi:hypothetical protein
MKKLLLLVLCLFLLSSCGQKEDMYSVTLNWSGNPDCAEFSSQTYTVFGNQLSNTKEMYCNNKCTTCNITKL